VRSRPPGLRPGGVQIATCGATHQRALFSPNPMIQTTSSAPARCTQRASPAVCLGGDLSRCACPSVSSGSLDASAARRKASGKGTALSTRCREDLRRPPSRADRNQRAGQGQGIDKAGPQNPPGGFVRRPQRASARVRATTRPAGPDLQRVAGRRRAGFRSAGAVILNCGKRHELRVIAMLTNTKGQDRRSRRSSDKAGR